MTKTILKLLVISAIAFSIGAQAATIYQNVDKFTKETHYSTNMQDADLDGGSFISSRYVLFSWHAFKPAINPQQPFILSVYTRTPEWIFIQSGESLHLMLDGGDVIVLSGDGSSRSREMENGSTVTESARWVFTPEQIRKVGAAKIVEFRLSGDRQKITGKLHKTTIEEAALFGEKGEELIGLTASSEPIKLGVQFFPVDENIKKAISYPSNSGAFILSVAAGSIADKAGIKQGDVITKFGDKQIFTIEDLQSSVAAIRRGDTKQIAVWRSGEAVTIGIAF